jgi:hypothetical protein
MNEKKRRTAKVLVIIAFCAAVSPHFSPGIAAMPNLLVSLYKNINKKSFFGVLRTDKRLRR